MNLAARFLRNPTVLNASSLFVAVGVNAVINLVWIAYLARVLEPDVWALLLLTQAFGIWLSALPDFGFNLSGARAVAQAEGPEEVGRVAYSVMASKAFLSLAVVPASAIAFFAIGSFRAEPLFLLGGALFAVAQGFDPMWLFQGTERQYIYAVTSTLARATSLALTVLLIDGPEDGWLAMFLLAAGALIILAAGLIYMRKVCPPVRIGARDVRATIADSWHVFQYRAAQAVFGAGLLVLGAVAPLAVQAYGNAERIVANIVSVLSPVLVVGLPRTAKLVKIDEAAASRTSRLTLAIAAFFGIGAASVLIIFPSEVIRILLGPDYGFVAPILRVAALALPLVTVSMMLGSQLMVALGIERTLVRITYAAGAINVLGIGFAGYFYGAMGAAVVLVMAHALATGMKVWAIRRAGHSEYLWRSRGSA